MTEQPDSLPEKDDALTGPLTYTPEYLRKHPAKLRQLLSAPDGTPGKDVALEVQAAKERDKEAAPLVQEGVKYAKEWLRLHGKAETVTQKLARVLAQMRTVYINRDGRPDMGGRSQEYRNAASRIYERAGIPADKLTTVQGAVRWYLADEVRKILKEDPRFAGGDEEKYLELCRHYKINPEPALVRQKKRRQLARAEQVEPLVPAFVAPRDDVRQLVTGASEYVSKALSVLPDEVDPEDLPEDAREVVIARLEEAQLRISELLDALV